MASISLAPINSWIGGKFFSLVHQNNLVYNTCWEDPRLDRVALEITPEDAVLVITSAGCNALDYAIESPKAVFAVDMNHRQNALLELKIAAVRELGYDDFFQLFGRGRLAGFAGVYRESLRGRLSTSSRKYWDRWHGIFDSRRSFYFRGSCGFIARMFNVYIDRVAKVRPAVDDLLEAKTVEEQREIYETRIRERLWRPWIRKTIGSSWVLSMLGVPQAQSDHLEDHYDGDVSDFIVRSIETVLTSLPIQDNYFWRVYLRGEYSPECCPRYLTRAGFEALKSGLVDRISAHTNTIEGFLRESETPISKFILLDHMDWLSKHRIEDLHREWQAIVDRADQPARILFRSGGRKVDYVDPIRVSVNGEERKVGEILDYSNDLARRLHEKCRVHTYGSFYIADLRLP